jgi:TonB family protein
LNSQTAGNMFPPTTPRSAPRSDEALYDLAGTLEHYLLSGFPGDLALDLVLNELVVRAAEATRASGAALALTRGDQMVCRAATGELAPGLGVPLSTRDGLSGACLQTRQPQLSVDTEEDVRVDREASRLLGIRSILVVPVFRMQDDGRNDGAEHHDRDTDEHKDDEHKDDEHKDSEVMGILEVFSADPGAFFNSDQQLLQGFATQCARIRVVATELSWHKPVADLISDDVMPPALPHADFLSPYLLPPEPPAVAMATPGHHPVAFEPAGHESEPERRPEIFPSESVPPQLASREMVASPELARSRYEVWSLVVGGLAIIAIVGVSFLIGSRVGWLRAATSHAWMSSSTGNRATPAPTSAASNAAQGTQSSSARTFDRTSGKAKQKSPAPVDSSDDLVVYDKGKVVFRMKPTPSTAEGDASSGANRQPADLAFGNNAGSANAVVEASSTTKIAASQSVWLSPQQAESRLLSRTEPQFPAAALAAHRAGTVVVHVQVAEDGSVASIRTVSGDPILANAAIEAVRNWRYQPYRQHDRPAQFQTDVTLTFALPN